MYTTNHPIIDKNKLNPTTNVDISNDTSTMADLYILNRSFTKNLRHWITLPIIV